MDSEIKNIIRAKNTNKFSLYEPVILKKEENEINPNVYVINDVIRDRKYFEDENNHILYQREYRYIFLSLIEKKIYYLIFILKQNV